MNGGPRDATATRSSHFGVIVRGRTVAYTIALGSLAVVAAAIVLDRPIVFTGAPIVVLIVIAGAFIRASKLAATDFYTSFAAAHGFDYYPTYSLFASTPLLAAGDRRHAEHYMSGSLGAGSERSCELSHYTFEVKHTVDNENGPDSEHWVARHFTVCCVDLRSAAPPLHGIYLVNHSAIDSSGDENWLGGYRLNHTELESSVFTERYGLSFEPAQDGIQLRQLFAPSLIDWFAKHPLAPSFEYQRGALVVFVKGHVDDGGNLQYLLDATRELAGRFESFGDGSAAAAA